MNACICLGLCFSLWKKKRKEIVYMVNIGHKRENLKVCIFSWLTSVRCRERRIDLRVYFISREQEKRIFWRNGAASLYMQACPSLTRCQQLVTTTNNRKEREERKPMYPNTPLQIGGCETPNLPRIEWCDIPIRGLVRTSVNWCLVLT